MTEQKTNVMRILEQNNIAYTPHAYAHGKEAVDGLTVSTLTGIPPQRLFKTLVARGAGKSIYVFVIPAAMELELKKAAKAVGEKSIAMVHVSEINALTGYIRGGCSPISMKKQYKTVFHSSAESFDTIAVSAGKIGVMVELSPRDLISITHGTTADIAAEV